MNKVIQAHLSGVAFSFDTNAYEALDEYLARINRSFRNNPGRKEIMQDIESRLAELFENRSSSSNVVTLEDVYQACDTIGAPEQFEEEQFESNKNHQSRSFSYTNSYTSDFDKRKRVLMRDSEDVVISGVCSGLAAYLGMDTAVWMRIAFALAVIFGVGSGVVIYIVLWIVMPQAKTKQDIAAMKGDPIDFDKLGKDFEKEMNDFSDKASKWGDTFSGKYSSYKNSRSNENTNQYF